MACEYLFAYMHPVEASNITLSFAAGVVLQAHKLTLSAVLPIIVLAYIAWLRREAIVDDYALLCQRYRDEYINGDFKYDKMPWCPALFWVGYIAQQERGGRNLKNNVLEDCPANHPQWLFDTYDRLVGATLEEKTTWLNS